MQNVHNIIVGMATTDGKRKDDSDLAVDIQKNGGSKDGIHELYMVLNSISANLDQLAENCYNVNDRMKELEMECIDLLQPIDDIIIFKRELKRLIEVESNYMKLLKNIKNNINTYD